MTKARFQAAAVGGTPDDIEADAAFYGAQHLRRVKSVASAVHSLVERIDVMTSEGLRHGYAVATNVFHKTALDWPMLDTPEML
ncbi:MAG: hypothetical protein RL211_1252 [Pseudomonadota bacterium]|jgi:hypothetical protein